MHTLIMLQELFEALAKFHGVIIQEQEIWKGLECKS